MFAGAIPAEEPSDLVKPPQAGGNSGPYWIIADSRGILEGILHVFRGQNIVRMLSYWSLKEHLLHTFSTCGREILTTLPQA